MATGSSEGQSHEFNTVEHTAAALRMDLDGMRLRQGPLAVRDLVRSTMDRRDTLPTVDSVIAELVVLIQHIPETVRPVVGAEWVAIGNELQTLAGAPVSQTLETRIRDLHRETKAIVANPDYAVAVAASVLGEQSPS